MKPVWPKEPTGKSVPRLLEKAESISQPNPRRAVPVAGCSGSDHLGERELIQREIAGAAGESVEQRLREDGDVCRGAEEAGVTGDAFHAARGGVVHHTAQHGARAVG